MSSTPLFDAIARSTATDRTAPQVPTPAAPSSPISAPVPAGESMLVPAALVAAIDEIPSRFATTLESVHAVDDDQLPLVEAVADAITRAVVDAVVTELDRITRDGVVRA
jgi:hypothetical protein